MDMSVESAVTAALALQSMQMSQDARMLMMKKSLDAQSSAMAGLIAALPQLPSLTTHGTVGARVNTIA